MANLKIKSNEAEAAVDQLRSQLEELIRAKDEDETALLKKFRDLLNEKKVKIREQQRVLAASGSFNASHPGTTSQEPEEVKIKEEEPTKKPTSKPTRKAGKSRASKRKAPASKRIEEESEDEGVQAMEVDDVQPVDDQETDPGNTTEGTASASSDDEDVGIPLRSRGERAAPPAAEPREKTPPRKAKEQPPAPRNLPFGNKKSTKPAPAPAPAAGSETESDDEL